MCVFYLVLILPEVVKFEIKLWKKYAFSGTLKENYHVLKEKIRENCLIFKINFCKIILQCCLNQVVVDLRKVLSCSAEVGLFVCKLLSLPFLFKVVLLSHVLKCHIREYFLFFLVVDLLVTICTYKASFSKQTAYYSK